MHDRDRLGVAYDAIATEYDRRIVGDAWIRRTLWRHFDRVFGAGDRVLDAGCGTGIDAVHLAARGVRVTAIDVSEQMVARLRAKIAGQPTAARIEVHVGGFVDVAARLDGPFDGLISSFAALNTVDLAAFARVAAGLVRPGGRMICHLLAPGHFRGLASLVDLWRGRPDQRLRESRAVDIGGQSVDHLSLGADEVHRRFFQRDFELRERYGLGLLARERLGRLLPPPMMDLVGALDRALGSWPVLASAGRFFVLDLQRRPC